MGTETSYPIGTVLHRKVKLGDDLDELRVVGGGKQLIVTSNTGFSANFNLDANVARKDYQTDIPDTVYLSQPTFVDPGPTPEEVFQGTSAPGDGLSRLERAAEAVARVSEDPRTAIESVTVDTGVPTSAVVVGTSEPETPLERSRRAGRKGAEVRKAKAADAQT